MSELYQELSNLSPQKRMLVEKLLREQGVDLADTVIIPQSRATNQFPLSFAQQRLWFLDQLEPESPVYNNHAAVLLTGQLNTVALEESLKAIVQRHEVLRTTFSEKDETPVQVIASDMPLHLEKFDLQALDEGARDPEARRLIQADALKPFDLRTGPLFRMLLIQLTPTQHLIFLNMHHIVSDAWSLGLFIQEFGTLYKAYCSGQSPALAPLKIQYVDFACWHRQWLQGERLEKLLSYWKKQLEGSPEALDLSLDFPRSAYQSFQGKAAHFELSAELTHSLKRLSQQEDVTLFMLLMAGLQTLLFRYSGQSDICVGTPIANRNRVETERLIGFFVNTLVMRTDLSGNPSFQVVLQRVKQMALEAYDHQDLPFEVLVEKLQPARDLSRTPFFQVMLVHQNAPMQPLELPEMTIEPQQFDPGLAKFDLTVIIEEKGESLSGAIVYNTELFRAETIGRMMAHFQNVLTSIVADPTQAIGQISYLSQAEQQQFIEWSQSKETFIPIQTTSIHELFEAQVEKTPENVAVVFGAEQLTYQELNQRANQLAHYLKQQGMGPEKLVGVLTDRPIDIIISLLGILKTGSAFLPLDPNYPAERLDFMVRDSGVALIISHQDFKQLIPANGVRQMDLDRVSDLLSEQPVQNLSSNVHPDSLAYVIYTSGSTGIPKGVMISQGAVANHCLNMKAFYQLKASDRVLQFASFNFDASLEQTLPTLLAGASLFLRGNTVWSNEEFFMKVAEFGLTVVNLPTAYWHQLLHAPDRAAFANLNEHLRLLIIGGDVMSREDVRRWEKQPTANITLLNAYGPTEIAITATIFNLADQSENMKAEESIPIGRPQAHRSVYALDAHGQPVAPGIPGELYIGGDLLARGYLNRADLTAERFIPNQFADSSGERLYKTGDRVRFRADGNLEFLGRVDHQVKIRGFRIELGEIETALVQLPGINEAVVVARTDATEEKQLVAYLVSSSENGQPIASELRTLLKQKLPDYMLPGAFTFLEKLPRTPIGKIDRQVLRKIAPDQATVKTAYVPPGNPVEARIAQLWAEALELDRVGIHDNFFDLGGHSLMATRIISRLRKEYQVEIPLKELFEQPTVAQLALIITQLLAADEPVDELEQLLADLEALPEEAVHQYLEDD